MRVRRATPACVPYLEPTEAYVAVRCSVFGCLNDVRHGKPWCTDCTEYHSPRVKRLHLELASREDEARSGQPRLGSSLLLDVLKLLAYGDVRSLGELGRALPELSLRGRAKRYAYAMSGMGLVVVLDPADQRKTPAVKLTPKGRRNVA